MDVWLELEEGLIPGGKVVATPVCGGGSRMKVVLDSKSHALEVQILPPSMFRVNNPSFLIAFKGFISILLLLLWLFWYLLLLLLVWLFVYVIVVVVVVVTVPCVILFFAWCPQDFKAVCASMLNFS